jgi:hypothetical protein
MTLPLSFTHEIRLPLWMFTPGVFWSGFRVNRCGSFAQSLQMYSYGVMPLSVLSRLAKL